MVKLFYLTMKCFYIDNINKTEYESVELKNGKSYQGMKSIKVQKKPSKKMERYIGQGRTKKDKRNKEKRDYI